MKWFWTWSGWCFGYQDGDNLWTYNGKHVGKIIGNEIYGFDGRYLGEIKNDNRLITNVAKKTYRKSIFTPYANRVSFAKYADYVGYVMYAGYEDFPELEN